MISAKELRRKTEENKQTMNAHLRQELLEFLEKTEARILKDSGRGYFHSVIRLPSSILELLPSERRMIINNFYTSLGYEVTWNPKSTTFFSVSW